MKTALSLLAIIFLLTGCGTIQLTDTQEVASSILSRRVGYTIAMNYPETAEQLQPVVTVFIESGNILSLDTFMSILTGDIDDPLLKADIEELSRLIQIKLLYTLEEMEMIKKIMRAFQQGMEIGGVK